MNAISRVKPMPTWAGLIVVWLFSLVAIVDGQRVLGHSQPITYGVSVVGIAPFVSAVGTWNRRRSKRDPDRTRYFAVLDNGVPSGIRHIDGEALNSLAREARLFGVERVVTTLFVLAVLVVSVVVGVQSGGWWWAALIVTVPFAVGALLPARRDPRVLHARLAAALGE